MNCSSGNSISMTMRSDELIAAATAADRESVDLYSFTSQLFVRSTRTGRRRIVKMMWEMVYADGRLNEFEDNIVWRASDLLGISHRDRVEMRRDVAEAASRRKSDSELRARPMTDDLTRPVTHHHRRVLRHRSGTGAGVRAQWPRAGSGGAPQPTGWRTLADEIADGGRARPLVLTVDLGRADAGDVIESALADAGSRAAIRGQ